MPVRHEAINVRVSRRILWFGTDAHPLPNITRTNTLELEPNRAAAIRQYVLTVVAVLCVTALVASVTPGVVAALVIACGVGWLVLRTVKLVEFLKLRLYELIVETTAGSHRGLIAADPAVVSDLALRITNAIDNPHEEFQLLVVNVQVGDNFIMRCGSNVAG
jgi:hypothetical protein